MYVRGSTRPWCRQRPELPRFARALATLVSLTRDPEPAPGSQVRRAQNDVALQIAGTSLAYAIEQDPKYLAAAKTWTLAATDYEPWGYAFNKPNTDLAAGHLLYAIGWAYDLLYDTWTPDERVRIKASLERHAGLVYDAFEPGELGGAVHALQLKTEVP